MRILHVISSVDPSRDAAVPALRELARANAEPGDDIEVCSLDAPGEVPAHDDELIVHALGDALPRRAGAPALLRWLRANVHRFDTVIVHGVARRHGDAVWRAARELSFPYYVFAHGVPGTSFRQRFSLRGLRECLRWPLAGYRVLRDAEAVLFRCEAERALARRTHWLYRAREQVVGYGVCAPSLRAGQVDAFDEQLPQLHGKRFLLYIGQIDVAHGCDLLVEAFAQVARREPELQLVLAGPSTHRCQLQLAARAAALGVASRVHWAGVLTGDLKWGALRACDAFVLPSHEDSFGGAVVEAMACRKAVLVSTEVEIAREIAAGGGGLVAADTAEGTVSLLERWLELSSSQRRLLGERSRACYEHHFTLAGAGQRLRKLLDEGPKPQGV